jgi:hypothetical protein
VKFQAETTMVLGHVAEDSVVVASRTKRDELEPLTEN